MKKIILFFFFAYISVILFVAKANAQWVQVWNGMGQTKTVLTTSWNGTFLLAGLYWSDGIYISSNEGLTWNITSLSNKTIWDLTSNGTNYYASADDGIYISNNGINWTLFALDNKNVYEIALNNNYIFAGTHAQGIYYSTNNGMNWTQSFLNNKNIWSLAVFNNYVIAGTSGDGIYYSTDNGYIWFQSHINNLTVERIKFDGTIAYAGTSNGIYKSTNFGINWSQLGLPAKNINDIQFNGNYIYVSTDNYGIYYAIKQGIIWNQINEGFPTGNFTINTLVFTNNYFIAGSSNNSTWRRPKIEVGINQTSVSVPSSFCLEQNYPNPFNPTTKIRFAIQNSGFTTLKIFNIHGEEIEILVNKKLKAGTYESDWKASDYPSGVYFYRLTTGDFSETKKMMLIK